MPPLREATVAELSGAAVRLRPVAVDDAPALAAILATPEVATWWPSYDLDRVRRELSEPDEDELGFVIELDGRVCGYIQAWEEPDPEFRHAGIDLYLDPGLHGRGLGPDAIRTLAHWLILERRHHRLTIDPRTDNVRAIRAYEHVGFQAVGRMRQYQRDADGTWHDGLLMELLAAELSPDLPA